MFEAPGDQETALGRTSVEPILLCCYRKRPDTGPGHTIYQQPEDKINQERRRGMKIISTYGVKIKTYNQIFKKTVKVYRHAADFLIGVCLNEWEQILPLKGKRRLTYVESLVHVTAAHPDVKYDFDYIFIDGVQLRKNENLKFDSKQEALKFAQEYLPKEKKN